MQKQRGMSFIGLVLLIALVVFVAVIGIKVTPAYLEFMSVKKAVANIENDPGFAEMTKKDIQDAFDKKASVDYITVVKGSDIEVSKDISGKPAIALEYQVVKPIVANMSILLDFAAGKGAAQGNPAE